MLSLGILRHLEVFSWGMVRRLTPALADCACHDRCALHGEKSWRKASVIFYVKDELKDRHIERVLMFACRNKHEQLVNAN